MEFQIKERYDINDLIKIVEMLRDPVNGCPWDKVQTHLSIRKNFIEETYEAIEAIDLDDKELMQEELGDVLFAAVKVGRFAGVDPETALQGTCEKFLRRFRYVEQQAASAGKNLTDMSLSEMTALWDEAKSNKA